MDISKIKDLKPLARLLYWIREREAVRLARGAGAGPPWTDDVILRAYRFCNVRRRDDHVSRWLMENWYGPHKDHPNTLAAVCLARFFNLPSSLGAIGRWVFRDGHAPLWGEVEKTLRRERERGPIFNGAYMVRGNDGIDKIESVVRYNVRPLVESSPVLDPGSMQGTWAAILPAYGFGSFMAGQVTADLRWALSGSWADRNDWAPAGPGSLRGMNRLCGRPPNSPGGAGRWAGEFGWFIKTARRLLPVGITERLEAIDFQNCLCEYDKYCRALLGEGRPKHLYRRGDG